jgi:uncharacterized protein YjeT (DUF2065 family)
MFGRRARARDRRRWARYALGTIRLVNGTTALLFPTQLIRRMGVDPEVNAAATYALRMFGIRTVVIGSDLLWARGDALEHALRVAPLIHVSDTASAVIAGVTHRIPTKAAVTGTVISSVNVVLSFLAQDRRR